MDLTNTSRHVKDLPVGWHSRGYLPHFDGPAVTQFITLHLADAVPVGVVQGWERELNHTSETERRIVLQRRVERYLDVGYGQCLLKDPKIAALVQESLLAFDRVRYNLLAWVIMPNHTHSLLTPNQNWTLQRLMQSHKSYTAHQANRMLNRTGQFWMTDYFDRFIRNAEHFDNTVRYIENNPVKAKLCAKPSDWPFSSAWFRKHQLR